MKKNTVYPKRNRKPFDDLRKHEFDYWREVFYHTLDITREKYGLTRDQIENMAWNCAYEVVTDQHDQTP